ncbi:phosphatidylserine decarboxylase proenzyme, mitochondrial-like isoform X1 [Mytilus galloprovincialis]|uniref:phosphatidylserine decarboxylase proenzyme, mitochondrial-like isoform X1 n=1 Tax=Mytilus galloprovincialis TaxID=29158 RepID=UPI003F7B5DA6
MSTTITTKSDDSQSEDFSQIYVTLYSTILLVLLISGRHAMSKKLLKKLYHYSRKRLWYALSKLDPRQIKFYGLRWGIPSKELKELMLYTDFIKHKKKRAYRHKKKLNKTVTLYRKMPLKVMSRAWGTINNLELPVVMRRPLIGLYVWMFDCKLNEAADPDLRNYKNLGEFFRRTLKPGVRTVNAEHDLTSPADGRILHYGICKNGILEQVKGVTYSLKGFLGPLTWRGDIDDVNNLSDEEYHQKLKLKPGHELYHCVVYLAPGDYHRFHSASDWKISYRRHFPGDLLSVSPGIARWIEGLFNFNERVVYAGTWKHGFFSYTAVGATNVGSIRIYCDEELTTNHRDHVDRNNVRDACIIEGTEMGKSFQKGDMFGEFNLGSTIVLIFEAPRNFEFKVQTGQKVSYGQPLGFNRHVDLL